jgi:hypothetical protein
VESPLEFWQNNATKIQNSVPVDYIAYCVNNLLSSECLSSIGLPMGPMLNTVFGGFNLKRQDYTNSTALVVTYMLKNENSYYPMAILWENKFIEILEQPRKVINVVYSSEVKFPFSYERLSFIEFYGRRAWERAFCWN